MAYENSFTLRRMALAYTKPLRFSGRSTRTELLGYLVIAWLSATILSWLALITATPSSIDRNFLSIDILNLLFWLPFPALAVRRFDDEDRSGWWALPLILCTVLTWIGGGAVFSGAVRVAFALIYLAALVLLFWTPTDGPNRYGPDPRLESDPAELESV